MMQDDLIVLSREEMELLLKVTEEYRKTIHSKPMDITLKVHQIKTLLEIETKLESSVKLFKMIEEGMNENEQI